MMGKSPRASIPISALPGARRKLKRRADELDQMAVFPLGTDWYGSSVRVAATINATIDDVFGVGTADAQDFYVDKGWFTIVYSTTYQQELEDFQRGLARAKDSVASALKRLNELEEDAQEDATTRVLRAYEGLTLHPEIALAASQLYRDGYYAHAVEDSVKALNSLVRLRSGVEDQDGSKLMEYVFSQHTPLLAFNELLDEQDRNEQRGFMMMFSGAVAGLRNPRAHRIIEDDPERALEFIAYVSLLAKLLDGAQKRSRRGKEEQKH